MRNLIIGISLLFVAIIAVSNFYFSSLGESEHPLPLTDEVIETDGVPPTKPTLKGRLLWTYPLYAGATTRPSVWLTSDSTRFILVQDAYHILHAVSAEGKKIWNAQLPGPIVDSISQLPDHSLVFSTNERLYRIDTQGDPLPGFSLRLPQRATQGAIIASHGNTIRIEIATSRHVLSYDGRGQLLQQHAQQSAETHNTNERKLADLPHDCGPFAYIGPLQNGDHHYLICGKKDNKLHCFLH